MADRKERGFSPFKYDFSETLFLSLLTSTVNSTDCGSSGVVCTINLRASKNEEVHSPLFFKGGLGGIFLDAFHQNPPYPPFFKGGNLGVPLSRANVNILILHMKSVLLDLKLIL